MTNKTKGILSLLGVALMAGALISKNVKFASFASAPLKSGSNYTLTFDRNISSSEISAGKAIYTTANGNPITFAFDSEYASTGGIIALRSGGKLYNESPLTGITNINITLSSGNAIISYGNSLDALYIGSTSISGTSPITVNLSTPSDYFRISNITNDLTISSLSITYSCTNSYGSDEHEGAKEFTTNSWEDGTIDYYFVTPANSKVIGLNEVIGFDVKFITDSGQLSFYLNQYWNNKYCGLFTLTSSGVISGEGATVKSLSDGWFRITINLANTSKYGDDFEFVSRINLFGTTASGFIKYVGNVEKDIHEGAKQFTSSNAFVGVSGNFYFVTPPDQAVINLKQTIIFDVKFISNTGKFQFFLNEYYYGRYCGSYSLTAKGVISGMGATVTTLEDDWYRITIDLTQATTSATKPSFVSWLNISGTNADGYVKYMGLAKEFTPSSTWADGTVNFYFVTPSDSVVIDLEQTIAFDVKFTSDSGELQFYLNEYFYGRWCGSFKLTTSGVLTGSGATLTRLSDEWYRITIDLSKASKSNPVPNFVSRVYLVSTTANGFITYMGVVS